MTDLELKTPEPQVTINYRGKRLTCEVFTWTGEWHWKLICRGESTRYERKQTARGSRWQKTAIGEVPDTVLTALLDALYTLQGWNTMLRLRLRREQERRSIDATDNA